MPLRGRERKREKGRGERVIQRRFNRLFISFNFFSKPTYLFLNDDGTASQVNFSHDNWSEDILTNDAVPKLHNIFLLHAVK